MPSSEGKLVKFTSALLGAAVVGADDVQGKVVMEVVLRVMVPVVVVESSLSNGDEQVSKKRY